MPSSNLLGAPLPSWPVLRLSPLTAKCCFVASSRHSRLVLLISMPAISSFSADAGAARGSLLALPSPSKSSKLLLPSLCRARLAFSPSMAIRSTTICPDSRGSTATDTRAESTAANDLPPFCSDRFSLPNSIPSLGKKESLIAPSIASVRWVFSLTASVISVLNLLGSKLALMMASAIRARARRPAKPASRYFRIFIAEA